MFVCVVFGKLNMWWFVLSVIYNVKCCASCAYVCVRVCWCFNVFVDVACDLLCDAVRGVVVFAFVSCVGVCFVTIVFLCVIRL